MSEERLKYNKKVLKYIEEFLEKNDDLRFCQALAALDINPSEQFYEEPHITFKKLEEKSKGGV